ncbi:MAG: 3'-5' exonuclease, partial [Cyclobacteriaceae bacterium]|nr:3'-5' exonuclease [Cyclobacteriaceae bacterium]
KDVAKDIYKFLEGSDLAGYNMLKFDLPLLSEEFYRVDINFDVSKRKLVDAQKIFHLMEKRTLSAAYEFYCNKSLEDAHSAEADTFATYEVLKAQVEKYDGKDVVDGLGKVLGKIENNIEKLHEITASNIVDFAGRLVYNAQGEEIFNFGKHKGKTVQNVLQIEPQYYDWIMNSDFPMDTKRKLTQIKLRNFQK